jgi:high frequency lysogenization protein
MSHYNQKDRTIAFAGVYQAAQLVHYIATQGQADSTALNATLNSLFVENPNSTLEVFGELSNIRLGLQTLRVQMGATSSLGEQRNIQITQYVISILMLEKIMAKEADLASAIFRKLETSKSQMKHFGLLHENTLAGLALVYSETLARTRPKIIIKGAHGHLTQQINANRIRACLLAGVRAARLWRQVGGRRWQIIFGRGKYIQEADKMLAEMKYNDMASST